MPELRTDWLTGRVVLVAEDRARRPNEFGGNAAAVGTGACPFCAGNEYLTPPAVYERLDAAGRWQVRAVPNKFPAVTIAEGSRTALADSSHGWGDSSAARPACGAHEVIIESARHVDRMSLLSLDELRGVLAAYAARLRHWRDDGRFCYGLVFKNEGPRAGASLAHVHSQLIALPDLPPLVAREIERVQQDFDRHQICPTCRLVEQERKANVRVVLERDGFIAFCPFASLQPMETWLLPIAHEPAFEEVADDSFGRLAGVLHALLESLEATLPMTNFNLLLRTAPWHTDGSAARAGRSLARTVNGQHWRLELLPRVTSLAGLELAAGVHINPLPPEAAASRLRGRATNL
jgi:UDPglucose--hexose-1-phosphate uridylyltransferase